MQKSCSVPAIEQIVLNTGPLIALAKINALDIIGKLPFSFICPAEVREELDAGMSKGYVLVEPNWLSVVALSNPLLTDLRRRISGLSRIF